MFENKLTHNGIHYSRYIASWQKSGTGYYSDLFKDWLYSEGLTDDEVHDIYEMATNGKMELEMSVSRFLQQKKDEGYFELKDYEKTKMQRRMKRLGLA